MTILKLDAGGVGGLTVGADSSEYVIGGVQIRQGILDKRAVEHYTAATGMREEEGYVIGGAETEL